MVESSSGDESSSVEMVPTFFQHPANWELAGLSSPEQAEDQNDEVQAKAEEEDTNQGAEEVAEELESNGGTQKIQHRWTSSFTRWRWP